MKKLLFILIFLSTIFFAGCSASYDLVVDTDGKVKESFYGIVDNETVLKYNDTIDTFLDSKIYSYENMDIYKPYTFSKKIDKDTSYVKMERTYSSLESYIEISPLLDYLFEKVMFLNENGVVTFVTSGDFYYENIYPENSPDSSFYIDEVKINIVFYNKVISNNADSYDENTNTYTWIINEDTKLKGIEFKLSDEIRYDVIVKQFFKDNMMIFIAIGVIILAVLIVISALSAKIKNRNNL